MKRAVLGLLGFTAIVLGYLAFLAYLAWRSAPVVTREELARIERRSRWT